MGFKHLIAYFFIIAGIALLPLLFVFFVNSQVFNSSFLIILAGFAFASCLAGGIMLKKLS